MLRRPNSLTNLKALFDEYDSNNNGTIENEELKSLLGTFFAISCSLPLVVEIVTNFAQLKFIARLSLEEWILPLTLKSVYCIPN